MVKTKPAATADLIEADAAAEFNKALADTNRARAERDAVQAEVQTLARAVFEADQRAEAKDVAADDAAATAYLDGAPIPSGAPTLRQRLADARSRLAVLERATQIARTRMRAARDRLDSEAAKEARPRHAEAVRRIADALIDLSIAIDEEEAIRAELANPLKLGLMGFSGVGSLAFIDSNVSHWLKRASGLGFIPRGYRENEYRHKRAALRAAHARAAAKADAGEPEPPTMREKIERAAARTSTLVGTAQAAE